ncbi:hypothetical protein Cob_v002774 [Colletotrichum orbiculare MAFF 240422]|uniref:Uncharacterized protein n=1 Tax=Colletotrichum orbiculare (strain 104-T / ATCC 96160 / CBS 514.97 / LARS 414 / MAFF 240422) TaxID=1213857 RepID=A0A484G2F8_COLOR|nr:hypothetical protein Cob_v002774 [Colletotrichum orbiculare MAFF 240422]
MDSCNCGHNGHSISHQYTRTEIVLCLFVKPGISSPDGRPKVQAAHKSWVPTNGLYNLKNPFSFSAKKAYPLPRK